MSHVYESELSERTGETMCKHLLSSIQPPVESLWYILTTIFIFVWSFCLFCDLWTNFPLHLSIVWLTSYSTTFHKTNWKHSTTVSFDLKIWWDPLLHSRHRLFDQYSSGSEYLTADEQTFISIYYLYLILYQFLTLWYMVGRDNVMIVVYQISMIQCTVCLRKTIKKTPERRNSTMNF